MTTPSRKSKLEGRFENLLFSSRWLMAPMYLGLVVAMALLTLIFLRELMHMLPNAFEMEADEGILAILSLIDLSLSANLLVIVLFSGYENFVSKIELAYDADRPEWMGTIDFSALKMKLIASVVAISGIHLLKVFMSLGKGGEHAVSSDAIYWMTVIHIALVSSGVLLALMDWLSSHAEKH